MKWPDVVGSKAASSESSRLFRTWRQWPGGGGPGGPMGNMMGLVEMTSQNGNYQISGKIHIGSDAHTSKTDPAFVIKSGVGVGEEGCCGGSGGVFLNGSSNGNDLTGKGISE